MHKTKKEIRWIECTYAEELEREKMDKTVICSEKKVEKRWINYFLAKGEKEKKMDRVFVCRGKGKRNDLTLI